MERVGLEDTTYVVIEFDVGVLDESEEIGEPLLISPAAPGLGSLVVGHGA